MTNIMATGAATGVNQHAGAGMPQQPRSVARSAGPSSFGPACVSSQGGPVVYGSYIDELVAYIRTPVGGAPSVYYAHNGAQYSIQAVTDSQGNLVERYSYGSYGGRTVEGVTNGGRSVIGLTTAFTGRALDEETGLVYFRRRMYSPQEGRFISRDPVGPCHVGHYLSGAVGVLFTIAHNGQLYAYAVDRPFVLDPSGMDGESPPANSDASGQPQVNIKPDEVPRNSAETAAMREAANNGQEIMKGKILDPAFPESQYAKMSYARTITVNGVVQQVDVHYWQDRTTGAMFGFKIAERKTISACSVNIGGTRIGAMNTKAAAATAGVALGVIILDAIMKDDDRVVDEHFGATDLPPHPNDG